ncbi:response regulator transcription factor [Streptomyces sp. NBC_01217]|uniref:response regulator transcription factor n=1 Tax=Streptomyces sp. NBC_01217 TaxID=2903779 RepID=UPI002E10BFC7|nr:response regulator transcription factor [Streptomyces sp. NBC_01217]
MTETGIRPEAMYAALPTARGTIRLAIMEEDPLIRAGVSSIVRSHTGIEVVDDVDLSWRAMTAPRADVDVLLVGGELLSDAFIQALAQGNCDRPDAEVGLVAVLQANDTATLRSAVMSSARGFVDRGTSHKDIGPAVREVYEGRTYLSSSIAATLVSWAARWAHREQLPVPKIEAALTERELQILEALGDGMTNTAIARRLNIQEATVRSHTYHILNKLNLSTRTEAALAGHSYVHTLHAREHEDGAQKPGRGARYSA